MIPFEVRIGRFDVIKELEPGSTCRVFLAKDAEDVRVVKQLRAEDEDARLRFEREVSVAERLDHPNIVRILWSGEAEGRPCLAMEHIAGPTLLDVISNRRGVVPPAVAVKLGLDVLAGLEHAHGQSVIHRDVSPDNILVGSDGRARIIDFGVARAGGDDLRTAPGMRLGTLLYMAPEQALSKEIDHRADLYAVAVLLYELLTGKPLVTDTDTVDVLEEIAYRSPPPVDEVVPDVSAGLSDVVAQGLSKAPEHRHQTAQEFAAALRAECETIATDADVAAFVAEREQDFEETMLETMGDGDTISPDAPQVSGPVRLPPPSRVERPAERDRKLAWIGLGVGIGFALGVAATLAALG